MTSYNLPSPPEYFVGRGGDIRVLEEFLSSGYGVISISGEGGVGKTTLALEFCKLITEKNLFSSIVWTTGKEKILATQYDFRTVFRPYIKRIGQKGDRKKDKTWVETLDDLYYTIYQAYKSIAPSPVQQKSKGHISKEEVQKWLNAEELFIVVDDLDSWENKDEIIMFLRTIKPKTKSRALVTVRYEISSSELPGVATYQLRALSDSDMARLLDFNVAEKKLNLLEQEKSKLLDTANGNPLVLNLSVALLSATQSHLIYRSRDTETILNELANSQQILEYLYDNIIGNITTKNKNVLLAIAVLNNSFPKDANFVELQKITGLSNEELQKATNELGRSSLINRRSNDDNLIDMHEMTCKYLKGKEPVVFVEYIELAKQLLTDENG